MILRGALLLVSLFADIDSGKKATPVVAIRICKICGQAPLESFACKIQVITIIYKETYNLTYVPQPG